MYHKNKKTGVVINTDAAGYRTVLSERAKHREFITLRKEVELLKKEVEQLKNNRCLCGCK